jgi:hypothetical protein
MNYSERALLFYEISAGNPQADVQEIRECFDFDSTEMLIIICCADKGYVKLLNDIWKSQGHDEEVSAPCLYECGKCGSGHDSVTCADMCCPDDEVKEE